MLRPYTRRLLLLLPTTTYRTAAFVEAARRLGVELTVASERPSTFEGAQPAALLTLDFAAPERAAEQAAEFARRHPVAGVVGVDDDTAVVAAAIAGRLELTGKDRKSTRLNSSHSQISYAVFCLKKKKKTKRNHNQRH